MPAFVIFVEGADTEPAKIPVYVVESEEHASLLCEGMKVSDYGRFNFSFQQCNRSDRGKFAVWAIMIEDAQKGVYGNIVGGIHDMIDGACSIMGAGRYRENNPPGAGTETGNGGNQAESDDALPKSERADSPSRTKARSAYDYAMERIPNAHAMTAPELFDAIKEDGEVAAMLPPTAESFTRYLNDCGIRLKKGGPKAAGGSVVRRSDL